MLEDHRENGVALEEVREFAKELTMHAWKKTSLNRYENEALK